MAASQITYFLGAPIFGYPWNTYFCAVEDATIESATEDRLTYIDAYGHKVVFHGSFDVNGGMVTGGTMVGFTVFAGETKLFNGTGYDVPATDLTQAIVDYQDNDNFDGLRELIWDIPLVQVGSDQDDYLYGTTVKGTLQGRAGDDWLRGHDANEVLKGGAGDDFIMGGYGYDKLWGDSGKDTFFFGDTTKVDRVMDFSAAEDLMLLDVRIATALGVGRVSKGEFHVGANAVTADQYLIYNPKSGALFYDPDANGAATKVQIAQLDDHLALLAKNFFVSSDFIE